LEIKKNKKNSKTSRRRKERMMEERKKRKLSRRARHTLSDSSLVLPQLGSAGFGFVFAGFAGGSATLVNQANYF